MQQTPNNSTAKPADKAPQHKAGDNRRLPQRVEDLFNFQQLIKSFYLFMTGLALIIAFFIVQNLASVKDGWQSMVTLGTPFIWGICIAYVLTPLLKRIELWLCKSKFLAQHFNTRRAIGIIITLGIVSLLLGVFFSMVIPEIVHSVITLFNTLTNSSSYDWLREYLGQILAKLSELGITDTTMEDIPGRISEYLENPGEYLAEVLRYAQHLFVTAGMSLKNILLAIIVSIYLMIGKETFLAQSRKIVYACAETERAEHFLDFCSRTNRIFSGFISGKLLDSLIIGILCFILMNILRLDYAMLISLIIGVTNVIPFFGPFIGAIPSILLLLIISPKQALIFAIMVLALQQFDGNILGPKILGGATGLTSFWVIFAVIIMGGTLGLVGMFIGVPIFATIYMVTKNVVEKRLRKKKLPVDTQSYK